MPRKDKPKNTKLQAMVMVYDGSPPYENSVVAEDDTITIQLPNGDRYQMQYDQHLDGLRIIGYNNKEAAKCNIASVSQASNCSVIKLI